MPGLPALLVNTRGEDVSRSSGPNQASPGPPPGAPGAVPYPVRQSGVQQVARLGVDKPLGRPSAPRGVQQEERVLTAHALWGAHWLLLGHFL